MARRLIDISVPLQASIASDPPGFAPEIEYLDHRQTAADVCRFFPDLTFADLPGGEGWAIERLRIVTHNATHLDAPYHFHSTMNRGQRAITIDVPLEWCFKPGVKLDFRHFADGYVATAADVDPELERIGHDLQPLDMVDHSVMPNQVPPRACGRTFWLNIRQGLSLTRKAGRLGSAYHVRGGGQEFRSCARVLASGELPRCGQEPGWPLASRAAPTSQRCRPWVAGRSFLP
jgi:Putative cyclase